MECIKGAVGLTLKVSTGNLIGNLTDSEVETSNDAGISGAVPSGANVVISVKELRKTLTQVISSIMNDPIKSSVERSVDRIVFLVDDLDRVEPSVAVQILDVMKNVMELRDCVFILAIDFDVVVQGLKSKFGDRSNQTEREHRQYFDKIIQVPFVMPVNVYRDRIATLVTRLLKGVGISCNEGQGEKLSRYAWALTDGTPRSIKRVVNTLSLLSLLPDGELQETESKVLSSDELSILFVFICLQINFPAVFNQIARAPNINEWTIADLQEPLPSGFYDDDDEWRLVLRCICQKDVWSSKKGNEIQRSLAEIYDGPIRSLEGNSTLSAILSKLSVTNVNPGSFVGSDDGVYDYFVLGNMTARSVLIHKDSRGMVIAINWFSRNRPKEIEKILRQFPEKQVRDIIPGYQELVRDKEVLGAWSVKEAVNWKIFNVIEKCLCAKIDDVHDILNDTHGNTKLKKAFSNYWG